MSKRLQVVLGDDDIERYTRTARSVGLTVSEWARQALRAAEREQSSGDVDAKLAAIRTAAARESGGQEVEVEQMLAETDAGRTGEGGRSQRAAA